MNCTAMLVCVLLHLGLNPGRINVGQVAEYTCRESTKYRIDPFLVLAIMKRESNFRQLTKPSKTNDYGIMQIHCPPGNRLSWCNQCDIRKLKCNIHQGIRILDTIRANCLGRHAHKKSPWIRHYNWNSKRHYKKIQEYTLDIKEIAHRCLLDHD
jgi:hypothetical protein